MTFLFTLFKQQFQSDFCLDGDILTTVIWIYAEPQFFSITLHIYQKQCCQKAPRHSRRGRKLALMLWISMKRCLGERLVSGCKALKLAPAWSNSFSIGFYFFFLTYLCFDLFFLFLIYNKKQLRGIFIKKTKIRVKKELKKNHLIGKQKQTRKAT
jgi:hypothetical protein